jgi:hypothetical protein
MSPSVYPIYDTLPDASDHLRLLTVHAGGVSEPIRCTLRTVSLHDKPFYDALSYTWGDSAATESIEVDGYEIQVTANLEQALRHLRDTEDDLTLWVDAVCINQSDTSEKSQQVAFMGQIYRECAQVRIWLGCDSSKCGITRPSFQTSNAVDGSSGVVDPFELVRLLASDRHIHEWPCSHTQSDQGCDTTVYKANNEFDMISEAFIAVIDSPWWTRMWTVQEAILPKKGLLVYDIWSTTLQTITDCGANCYHHYADCCVHAVTQLPLEFEGALENFLSATIALHNSRERNDDGNVKLYGLQEQHIGFGFRACKDPRDKVYGLLGIVKDISLTPDYTWSTGKVFLRATCYMICHERGTLKSLTGPGYGPVPGKWASWVREFDATFDSIYADVAKIRNTVLCSTIFDASYGHKSNRTLLMAEPPPENSSESLIGLEVVGRLVGRVDCVSDEMNVDFSIRNSGKWRAVFRQWISDALHWDGVDVSASTSAFNSAPGDGSGYPDTSVRFWRTLLGGIGIMYGTEVFPSSWTKFTPVAMYWRDNFFSWLRDEGVLNHALQQIISLATYRRCYFRADGSGQGLYYSNTCVGDEVWVLEGGNVPFILRPTYLSKEEGQALRPLDENNFKDDEKFEFMENRQSGMASTNRFSQMRKVGNMIGKMRQSGITTGRYYQFIGDCYYDGFMHGEAIHNTTFKEKTIVLV